jgi:hypothetical protein
MLDLFASNLARRLGLVSGDEFTLNHELQKPQSVGWFRGLRRQARRWSARLSMVFLCFSMFALPVSGKDKEAIQYGTGLIVNIPFPEAEVVQAVQDVVQNGIVRGTKEYNKDEFVTGATAESASHAFPQWTEGGKVFYKQRLHAIDPRNFKDGGDVCTLAVRYVVKAQDDKNTILRINAVFLEDFRRVTHLSNGSIESSEYKDVHDHIEEYELMKQQTVEGEQAKQRRANARAASGKVEWSSSSTSSAAAGIQAPAPESSAGAADSGNTAMRTVLPSADPSADAPHEPNPEESETLEQRVQRLRQQVERKVKSPGAPLKSAPFHTAGTLVLLASGTEVLIVISSPYWYGVETHEGQHGWIPRDDVEPVQ